jgi:hypothetical protein
VPWLSRHTSTWEVHATGYTGEAEWCPEASSRGDAKQPRRRAGRRSGAHTGVGWGGQTPMGVCVLRWQFGDYEFYLATLARSRLPLCASWAPLGP